MHVSTSSVVAYLASWLGLLSLIRAFFSYAEGQLNERSRQTLARWINHLDFARAVAGWPQSFLLIFDRIFGERHLSWGCFVRSSVVSTVAVILLLLFWIGWHSELAYDFFNRDDKGFVISVLLLGVAFNFIPDYVSLLQTRYVMQHVGKNPTVLKVLMFLLLDLVATVAIWLLFFPLSLCMIVGSIGAPLIGDSMVFQWQAIVQLYIDNARELWNEGLHLGVSHRGALSIGIWFYSTLFTSLWLWLYIATAVVVVLSRFLTSSFDRLRKWFRPKEKPLHFLGIIASIIVTLMLAMLPLITWFFFRGHGPLP